MTQKQRLRELEAKAVWADLIANESEDSLQTKVMALAKVCGWRRIHFRPARTAKGWRTAYTGDDGFPDTLLIRTTGYATRMIVAELKKQGKKPTEDQQAWLDALRRFPAIEVYTWRPADWPDIVSILA